MMKILLLGDIRPLHLKRWRDYFRSRGHEVHTVSIEEDPSENDYIHIRSRMPVPAFKYYLKKRAVSRIVRFFEPDIISAHFVPNYGLLAVATAFHPVAVTLWGSDILISPHRSWLHRARALWVLRNCDLITSDSRYMANEAMALGQFDTDIITEPMGVPRASLDSLAERMGRKGTDKLTILSTRRLEPVYGVEVLIRALCKVRGELPPFRCIICGDGSRRAGLASMVDGFGLSEVEFVTWKFGAEYLDLLAQADVYVTCSKTDSTSVSLLEAMAAGALPVVTDIPGNREWVEDDKSALMFPVGNVDVLASRLLRAATDHRLRTSALAINRKTVESRAVWEDNMARIEKAFEELVSKTKQ